MKRYALISVSDKTGIDFLASELVKIGFEIISTGGTADFLQKNNISVIPISEWTGFPEILDGRVKTLHPKVHAGILADLDFPEHLAEMQQLNLQPIELVAVNLYPFENTVANPSSSENDIIENIDIGGPALIRSAAKNFRHVTVLTDSADFPETLFQLQKNGKTDLEWRRNLAAKAFAHVERYDKAISDYFQRTISSDSKSASENDLSALKTLQISAPLVQAMRYGENPHQKAGYFSSDTEGWKQLHGKPLSYNNLQDLDAALRAINLYEIPTALIFKHTIPCGIGSSENLTDAYRKAFACDPLSPYGGIIIVNRTLGLDTVSAINEIFSEIIIAPDFDEEALAVLKKRKDRRLVQYNMEKLLSGRTAFEVRSIISGFLVQEWEANVSSEEGWKVVTERKPSSEETEALRFAWKAAALLKSNSIALTYKDRTIGLGSGQTSRIDSAKIAVSKAQEFSHDVAKAVCASDGFFPFRDCVDFLAKHNVKAIIQPGGSKGDADVIAACNEFGISMIMTGMRHFRH
ncbi:MAG TPA: bifunctional phosphoribosylaminoimidazolecarboxamide formyltransferase/IMP cyclohydrolase [Candidatus Cloacimonadota bacterium]|nr:bifunctional phosphoribosylaminoimidazolecarboxamide formyltransferase/IMP cyclohydrolase [Candidatus Cloacimonadota bacterium]HQL14931.1 bifunctional phosphoribosylaminoimidazolecarboxamide formyltransferase/IMP cyclohydrolase [Candidatus Cloacimonadota bacterium]